MEPRVRHVKVMRGSAVWTAVQIRFSSRGMTNRVWPMTIAHGVKSRLALPSGPWRDRIPYRTSPTTTVGSAISALSPCLNASLPANGVSAMTMPAGMANTEAMATASPEVAKDVRTIANNAGSALRKSSSALEKDSTKKLKGASDSGRVYFPAVGLKSTSPSTLNVEIRPWPSAPVRKLA